MGLFRRAGFGSRYGYCRGSNLSRYTGTPRCGTSENLKVLFGAAKIASLRSRPTLFRSMSKAAVNMAGVNLALDLKPRGIPVLLLHPGMVKTDMGGGPGSVEAKDAAARMVARIDEMSLDNTGTFRHAEGHELPW